MKRIIIKEHFTANIEIPKDMENIVAPENNSFLKVKRPAHLPRIKHKHPQIAKISKEDWKKIL